MVKYCDYIAIKLIGLTEVQGDCQARIRSKTKSSCVGRVGMQYEKEANEAS